MTVTSYLTPRSVPEATDLLARYGVDALVMAGGTVAMPLINEGISLPEVVLGLRHVGLDSLETSDGVLHIGATTTMGRLATQDDVPLLAEAARSVGGWAIRNMATVGGNLFTPPPGGDVAVALLALDADVVLASPQGGRVLPIAEMPTGFLTTSLAPDELVTGIRVPIRTGTGGYEKFGRRHANTPSVVTVAVRIAWDDGRVVDARIALGAVGPHPLRAIEAERILVGSTMDPATVAEAASVAAAGCDPFTDALATAWYRRRMTAVVVGRVLSALVAPGTGS